MVGGGHGGAGEGGVAAAAAVPVPRPVAWGLAGGRQVGEVSFAGLEEENTGRGRGGGLTGGSEQITGGFFFAVGVCLLCCGRSQ